MAADVDGDDTVSTADAIAINRFYLGLSFPIGNTGQYQFMPGIRSYSNLSTDQVSQNYDAIIFGDVVSPFADDSPIQRQARFHQRQRQARFRLRQARFPPPFQEVPGNSVRLARL